MGLHNHCGSSAGSKTFAEDFSTPLRVRNVMSYGYSKKTKAGEHRSFLIRSIWVIRKIGTHSLTST